MVHVREQHGAGAGIGPDARLNHALPFACNDGTGLVALHSGGTLVRRQLENLLLLTALIDDDKRIACRGQQATFRKGPWIAVAISAADRLREILRIGPSLGVHDCQHTVVLPLTMARRE